MPNGAVGTLPTPLERRRATALRASRRPLPTVPPAVTEGDEQEEGPVFGEEGFGEPGAAAPARDERLPTRQPEAAPTVALAQEQQIQAAREFRTEQLNAQRETTEDKAAEKAKTEASERARKEMVQKATQYLLRGAKIGTSVTVVMLIVTFAIMNLQLAAINVWNRGKPMEIGGLQIPPLAMWEVVLVLVLDFLCIVLNPFTLFIIFFVTLFGGGALAG